jgi:hypothetical protein
MSKFKEGDIVIANESGDDITEGKEYVIDRVDDRGRIFFLDNVGFRRMRMEQDYTLSRTTPEFIINGSSMLFASQEDAENYALHSGNYTDGCTVEIARVIRRAVVKRTVSVSLEDTQ